MAGKLGRALVLLVLLAAALITQAPLAVFLLAFALVLLVLLRLDAAYLRRQVTAELLVPDKPVIQGEDFTLTVRLRNRSRLPIPALVVLLNAADEWGGGQITLRCAAMLGGRESAEQRITLNAGKSGVWSIAVRGITLRDHLGVFTAACPAAARSLTTCSRGRSTRTSSRGWAAWAAVWAAPSGSSRARRGSATWTPTAATRPAPRRSTTPM